MLNLPLSPSLWAIDQITIEGYVVVAELCPSTASVAPVAAEPGRIAPNPDIVLGPLSIAIIDVPDVLGLASQAPRVMLAASNSNSGWRSQAAEISLPGQSIATTTCRNKSILGLALTLLEPNASDLIDGQGSVDVALVDPDQWLSNCDGDALAAGANLAVLGNEVFQFGQATALGNGRFRLSRLVRGCGGTEWAIDDHSVGEAFCLLRPETLQLVTLPAWTIGGTIAATAASASDSMTFSGNCVRPLSPVRVTAEREPSGDLQLSWIRRSRAGIAWIDGIDAPLGESIERYVISISGAAGTIEVYSEEPSLTLTAQSLAPLVPGAATIQVRQIGDFGQSKSAQITVNLS